MRIALFLIGIVLVSAVVVQYQKIGEIDNAMAGQLVASDETVSVESFLITIPQNVSREAIVGIISESLGFDESKSHQLHDTYRVMQWDAFNDALVQHMIEKFDLTEIDREVLLTHANIYLDQEHDVLESIYIPGNYTFKTDDTILEIATSLINPILDTEPEKIVEFFNDDALLDLVRYVQNETELLPDLVPLPPSDVGIRTEGGRTLLVFSTIYYNQGKGNLELRADPSTIGTIGDFDREVFQRIYRENNTYRDRIAGTFHWHSEHLHYHFRDFIEYKLSAVENDEEIVSDELAEKSTFCIRDISRVYLDDSVASTSAEYRICGRERQGVTVGWGDAYFSTYPDQNLDITDLPSGTYRLTFTANPEDRFNESSKENNVSSALLFYDKDATTVEVLEIEPSDIPKFEHIHTEQNF